MHGKTSKEEFDREYPICQRRGHQDAEPSVVMPLGPGRDSWHVCKWCGTGWTTETTTSVRESTPHDAPH